MVKVIEHPVNGMKLITGKNAVLWENGTVCTPDEYDVTMSMKPVELADMMRLWEQNDKRSGYDWKYAVTTGILRKKPVRKTDAPDETAGNEAQDTLAPEPKEPEHGVLSPASVIFFVMTVVGLVAAGMSAYHTAVALASFGRPLAVGIVTGTVMVLFSATAFTAGRWFMQEKGAVRLFSIVFIALGAVIVAYSMLSTLTVNYDAWSGTEDEKETERLQDSGELELYERRLEMLAGRMEAQKKETERLEGEAEYWQKMSWARYDGIAEQLTASREKEDTLAAEYEALLLSRPGTAHGAETDEERPADVFMFLTGLFGGDADILRLFMQAVPAMFFDVIAPFALSCAVYLSEKRRKCNV